MTKSITSLIALSIFAFLASAACDVQSGMSRKSVEKYMPSPTPEIKATPTPEPIDPEEILTVDTTRSDAPLLELNISKQTRTAKCVRYDRVQINGDGNTITLTGGCQQVILNGDGNTINAEAVTEFVLNGDNNKIGYLKFLNGKRPQAKDNGTGNVVEKTTIRSK